MVKNHVLTISNTCRILTRATFMTHTKTHVAHDDIVCTREGNAIAIDGDSFTWCRLSRNIQIILEYQTVFDIDDTSYIEDDETVRLTDCIAQRAGTRVVQVGDMINCSTLTRSCCKTSPALSIRKGQLLCLCSQAASSQQG